MTERLWMLLMVGAIGILTAVVFQASEKLAALEESLEKLEDERTVWEDERAKHTIREKHLKQQLDDFRSQLKASELTINEETSRRLKAESEIEVLNKEVSSCNLQLTITQNVWMTAATSAAFGKDHAPKTGNSNSGTHPMLIKEFKTQAALNSNEEINGIAKLNEDIFVTTSGSNVIECFDSATLLTKERLRLKGYETLQDLQPCSRSQSLFIIARESTGKKFIINADPYNKEIINSWEVDGCGCIIGLSLTEDCNVFATCYGESKVIEYSSTGHLIQEIVLKPESGIVHPRLALKMANGNLLVSYDGKYILSVAGVAILNSEGDVLKSYSDPWEKTGMVAAMAIDRLGNVLVAEGYRGRVILLSPELEYKKEIVTTEHGIRKIQAMLLDEATGRLFVADISFNAFDKQHFEDGRVLVFDMK